MECEKIIDIITNSNNIFALFDDNKDENCNNVSLLMHSPYKKIIANNEKELLESLKEIETLSKEGYYLSGYISYEAGYSLIDKKIFSSKVHHSDHLILFYAFNEIEYLESNTLKKVFEVVNKSINKNFCVYDLNINESKDSYLSSINKIKNYLRSGDTYQVNYTMKYNFKIYGELIGVYEKLRRNQKVRYGAFFNFGDETILSLSPELFIKKCDNLITTKPMKGTAKRGINVQEDEVIKASFKADPKTISENVMIVDLLRNDLGRICDSGSVKVESLFEVETYKTLFQMISTISGEVDSNVRFSHVIKEMFPCGSITGAPKVRTMNIIDDLEIEYRGIYTGALGYLLPNNDFCFNVPIRTIMNKKGTSQMGIGSGIVYESDPQMEYEECLLKSKFLLNVNEGFNISECIQYSTIFPNKETLSDLFLSLSQSAVNFGFSVKGEMKSEINSYIRNLPLGYFRIRVDLFIDGNFSLYHTDISNIISNRNILISSDKVNSNSPFAFNNTSFNRWSEERNALLIEHKVYDVLRTNENGVITQGDYSNLFISNQGGFITTPLSSGVINNSFRSKFIIDNDVIERDIHISDILSSEKIWLGSHFSGLIEVCYLNLKD